MKLLLNSLKLAGLLLLMASCGGGGEQDCTKINELEVAQWKFEKGYSLGDVLVLGEGKMYRIGGKCKILKGDAEVASIIMFNNKQLLIESNVGERGVYSAK